MTDQVSISITGLQKEIDNEPTVETATGSYALKNGHHFIRYEVEGVKCLLKISDRSVVTTRTLGEQVSRMEFIIGATTSSTYYAGGYPFAAGVKTYSIHSKFSENSITLAIDYDLSMNGSHVSRSKLDFSITSFTS